MLRTEGCTALEPALIVEDDPHAQQRLRALLAEVEPRAQLALVAGTLDEARALIARRRLAFALIDVGMPDGNGVELIAQLQFTHPEILCVVVSAWDQEHTVLAALQAGAIGYLLKERDDAELALALRNLQHGGSPIDPGIARRILPILSRQADAAERERRQAPPLGERERQILVLAGRGYSNREIAELTGMSRFSVEDYIRGIYCKLAVNSRPEAVQVAHAAGALQ